MEKAFILASLDDIAGNPSPLTQFYWELHQRRKDVQRETLVEAIKLDKTQRQQEEERQEERRQAKEQQQTVIPVKIPSPKQEDMCYLASSSSSSASSSSGPSWAPPPLKQKVKTRRIANPPAMLLKEAPFEGERQEEKKETIPLSSLRTCIHELREVI